MLMFMFAHFRRKANKCCVWNHWGSSDIPISRASYTLWFWS